MSMLFDPPEQVTAAIHGHDELIPVRRVFCVGRNYAAHAREMGKDPDREPPFSSPNGPRPWCRRVRPSPIPW